MNTPRDQVALLGTSPNATQRLQHEFDPGLLRKWPSLFMAGFIGLLIFLRSHFDLCLTKGESMLPGILSGDLLVVDKLAYRATTPERGDIVVARNRHDVIAKRVVGLPGEEVELHRGELLVNRRPFAEDYAVKPGWLSLRRGRLLEDSYALLGDNRSVPHMLSVHAIVSKDQIVGKVIYSLHLWPD